MAPEHGSGSKYLSGEGFGGVCFVLNTEFSGVTPDPREQNLWDVSLGNSLSVPPSCCLSLLFSDDSVVPVELWHPLPGLLRLLQYGVLPARVSSSTGHGQPVGHFLSVEWGLAVAYHSKALQQILRTAKLYPLSPDQLFQSAHYRKPCQTYSETCSKTFLPDSLADPPAISGQQCSPEKG